MKYIFKLYIHALNIQHVALYWENNQYLAKTRYSFLREMHIQ